MKQTKCLISSAKKRTLVMGSLALVSLAVCSTMLTGCSATKSSSTSLSSIASKVKNYKSLSQTDIANGLKEALNIGITKGISQLGSNNGFYNDAAARIGLPEEASVITENLSKLSGGEKLVESAVKAINAAASDAVTEAVPIFTSALTNMSISDATSILKGGSTAATDYFKTKTKTQLKSLFSKYIGNSLNKKLIGDTSAQSAWSTLTTNWNKVATSTAGKIAGLKSVNTDLTDYMADKAVDGVFTKIGEQEQKIRTNVSERTSDLLKRVFANQ